ncbi:MAG: hypothetical protein ACOCSJ_02660 [Candidatus Natronoplasma sp.]
MVQEKKDDDWRYKSELLGNLKDWRYLEWKYFSFDSSQAKGFFCYSVGNPSNILGLRKHIISYAVYHDGGKEVGMFEVDKNNSNVSGNKKWIFGNCIIQRKDDTWSVSGTSEKIDWDLIFRCRAKGKRLEIFKDHKKKRWMDWEIFCNNAEVKGSIDIMNKTIDIKGYGYYDSNLGHWKPAKNPWVWFRFVDQLGEKDLSFALFESRKTGQGYVLLSLDDETHLIEEFDMNYNKKETIPQKFRVSSKSEDIEFDLSVEVKNVELLTIKVFKFIPLLNLHLLKCDFELDIKISDVSEKLRTEGFGEYLT